MPRTTSGGQGAPTWQTFLMPCQSGASDGRTSAHEELVVIDLVTAVVPNLPPDRIRTLPLDTVITLLVTYHEQRAEVPSFWKDAVVTAAAGAKRVIIMTVRTHEQPSVGG